VACNRIRRSIQRHGTFRLSERPEVEDPRGAVIDGMSNVASLLAASYGPLGRTVSIEHEGRQFFTRSGVRIASGATGVDRFARQGLAVLARAAREASRQVGDGTKLTVLMAARMIQDANTAVETGFQLEDVLGGMRDSIAQVASSLLRRSVTGDRELLSSVA